jgi:ankyrin repeat protein
MPAKLTHNDLLRLGHLLGYELTLDGLCQGFSGAQNQAWSAKKKHPNAEKEFQTRLKFIQSYYKDFNLLKADIEAAHEAHELLTKVVSTLITTGSMSSLDEETTKKFQSLTKLENTNRVLLFLACELVTSGLIRDLDEEATKINMQLLKEALLKEENEPQKKEIQLYLAHELVSSGSISAFDEETGKKAMQLFEEGIDESMQLLKEDIEVARELVSSGSLGTLDEETRKNTMQLLDILAFYDAIQLYLTPELHTEIFNKTTNQLDVETIVPFVRPASFNEDDDMTVVFSKSYAFNAEDLLAYLSELEHQFENTDVVAPMFLGSLEHSICTKYDKDRKKWIFVDTNDFERYPDCPTYFSPLTKEELVERIFQSFTFGPQPSAHVIFTSTIVAARYESSELKRKFAEFEKEFPITAELANKLDEQGRNLLSIACLDNEVEMVNDLLDLENIRVNQRDDVHGDTPLILACDKGHLQTVQALLAHPDILIHQAAKNGDTPISLAIQRKNFAILRALLNHPNLQLGAETDNLMFNACKNGNHELVEELLKHDQIKANSVHSSGFTPLHAACMSGNTKIVDLLLNSNRVQNIHQANEDGGFTPLHLACLKGHTDVVNSLLNSNRLQNLNTETHVGHTPLMQACVSMDAEKPLIESLLQHGASITYKNSSQETALDYAILANNEEAIEAILEHAAAQKINIRSIVSNANYSQIQDLVRVMEQEQRTLTQLEQADEFISVGGSLLARASQMDHMTLQDKEEYHAEIIELFDQIGDSHICDPTEQNNSPELKSKAELINTQADDLETIILSIEKELRLEQAKIPQQVEEPENESEGLQQ